jgi:hypothetical protein
MEKRLQHEGEESQPVKARQRRGQSLIVSGQASETRGPSKGAFDHPPARQKSVSFSQLLSTSPMVEVTGHHLPVIAPN